MKFLFLLFSFLSISHVHSQTNTYTADLAGLKTAIQKTPSFKTQVKGEKLTAYNDLYNQLVADSNHTINSYEYFYNLARLMFPLRDNHLGFFERPNEIPFRSQASIDSFIQTKAFLDYPRVQINIDSLKLELTKKPLDSIEGIYHYDTIYRIGIYKSGDKEYTGVIIDSDNKIWLKGQVAARLYEYGPHMYKAIYGHPRAKYFLYQTNERFDYGSLVNSYFYASLSESIYSKHLRRTDHVNLERTPAKFEMKQVKDDLQYMLVRTFQADTKNSGDSRSFFDSIQNRLTAPNLLLDLRNNEGGAKKEMKKYYRLLRKYTSKSHLYILLNNGTLSQAEIFTLKLIKLKNVTTLGQRTKGMLSYGTNYGRKLRLPSGRFLFSPTDMKGTAELLKYEDIGINPQITLKDDSDWIEQAEEIISKEQ